MESGIGIFIKVMAIDLYQSRRAKFNRCVFYNCDPNIDLELLYKKQPAGIFYAVEVSPKRQDGNNIGNGFRIDRNNITVETDDDVDNLANDNVVIFKGQKWIVVDIQFNIAIKRSEFSRTRDHGSTVISLRR